MSYYEDKPRYMQIASAFDALDRCWDTGNQRGIEFNTERLEKLLESRPSGSGLDAGTDLDMDESKPERLVFNSDFHHMNEDGFYDGWTKHKVIVTPSLRYGCNIRITGRNDNDIKDYLMDVWSTWLNDAAKATSHL